MSGLRALVACAIILPGCGFDGVLFTPRGYDPTDPARASISGSTDPGSTIEVTSSEGMKLASVEAPDGEFTADLPPGPNFYTNLRLTARRGRHVKKAVVVAAASGEITGVGRLDNSSTAFSQLVAQEILNDSGSTFDATPPTAFAALVRTITSSPTPGLAALLGVIEQLDNAAEGEGPLPFDALGPSLDPGFVAASTLDASVVEEYRRALDAAARDFALEVRCDPTRLAALFTVDMSGRGRDGNGTPQLIRQASKEERVFIGLTLDESSSVQDDSIPKKLTPNDPSFAMVDDGTAGDEVAGDGIHSIVVSLPRGARLLYKYTNGAAREGFTGTEEWPGNARIIEVEDVLTGRPDGQPDCVIVRRDSFGDESSNKNFVNLNGSAKTRGGTVAFDTDLGGASLPAGPTGARLGGLGLYDARSIAPLTPEGVPEPRENGVCQRCPAPLALDPDDATPPAILSAERLSTARVRVRFSEPLNAVDASDSTHFELVDESSRSIRIQAAKPSGAEVVLAVEGVHPRADTRLFVKSIRDVSVRGNLLTSAEAVVLPDVTAPRIVSIRALGLRDVFPEASVEDPTRGEIVEVELDERPEESAAEDPSRYTIDGLEIVGAELLDRPTPTVRLRTALQRKNATYVLEARGVRDVGGNSADQATAFISFALFRVRFGVVPGFAFLDAAGATRGIPRGEKLYLTGTPLLFARDLQGRSISIAELGGRRTDVTGYRNFELKPSDRSHAAQPVWSVEMLLPPGSWAWKAAHGIEGEHTSPPPTLEKVYKVLATTNDATGVRVDPATLAADDGTDRMGARLSATGADPARKSIIFKREAPDEVCELASRDTECPFIVVGTWRDLALDAGTANDYDDGVPALPPHRPSIPDHAPPRLLAARARDSASILLAFDEPLVDPAASLRVDLQRADDGVGLPVSVMATSEVPRNQAVLSTTGTMEPGTAYTLRYRGATDSATPTHVDRAFRTTTVLAPDRVVPFTPLVDRTAPSIAQIVATDLGVVEVTFDERLDPATLSAAAFGIRTEDSSSRVAVRSAELLPDRVRVRLGTDPLQILAPYVLEVAGVADVADPPNAIGSTSGPFVGFGERDPPTIEAVVALSRDELAIVFAERMDAASAMSLGSYRIEGASPIGVSFSGDPARRSLAFNARSAPAIETITRLRTSPLTPGQSYALTVDGVKDRSGNAASIVQSFTAIDAPRTVTVVLEYAVTDSIPVAGQVPSRALGLLELEDSREGIFVIGARADERGLPISGADGPVSSVLHGFPEEGQPLDGLEPQLVDDGTSGDARAGDGVFSIAIPRVPLGTTMVWKAFAPYRTDFRDRNPTNSSAAFADSVPGPSSFSDGQEFPGNENGATIVGGEDVVRIRCIFGDEITYKKFANGPVFVWLSGGFAAGDR
ncbi:MAG: hypothetical protein HYV07_26345 [Deltaproteobacteria bacterium]|nr:hypothetical protein [Deltaproteobacteria bacterium]